LFARLRASAGVHHDGAHLHRSVDECLFIVARGHDRYAGLRSFIFVLTLAALNHIGQR
jgi:hypothetical protein